MQKFLAMREKMFAEAGVEPGRHGVKVSSIVSPLRTLQAEFGNPDRHRGYRLMPAVEKVIGLPERLLFWLNKGVTSLQSDGPRKLLGVALRIAGESG